MELEFLLLLSLIMCFASFVQGSLGFGFPLVATAFMALFTDIQTAIFYTLIPATFLNIVSITSEGNFFKAVKDYYPFALISIIGSSIGMYILLNTQSDIFKIILALLILLYLFSSKLKEYFPKNPQKNFFGFGFFIGLIGGLTNVMGPTFLIYALESKFTRTQTIQAGNVTFLSLKIVQIIMFGFSGELAKIEVSFSLSVLLAVSLFFYLGLKIKKAMDMQTYTKAIKVLLFIISIILLIQAF